MIKPVFNLVALRQGDKRVFDEIYKYFHQKLFYFANSYLKVEEDAIDIVQEVFIKLWENRREIQDDKAIEALMFSITKNAIISLLRKRSTEKKYIAYLETISTHYCAQNSDDLSSYSILKEHLDKITEQLPPKRKKVFVLSREQGLTNKEIATHLCISEKTVEGHLTKALAEIRQKIEPLGIFCMLLFYIEYL